MNYAKSSHPEREALRAKIAAGMNSGNARPAEEVFARLEAKYAAQVAKTVRKPPCLTQET
jgi:hypothetical protein